MTVLVVKATSMALAKHPVIDTTCRDGKSFTYDREINMAVAVATEDRLLIPVLHDADKVDVYTLSRKWNELAEKDHAKQLYPHECSTGFQNGDRSPNYFAKC